MEQRTMMRRVQPSYAHEEPYTAKSSVVYEGLLTGLGFVIGTLGSIPLCCCFPNPFKEIEQGSVGLVTKFGKFVKALDPGLYKINPFCENLQMIDIRMRVQDCPRQVVLTKDNVSIEIDSVLYWDILDPYTATFLVSDIEKSLIERTLTTLRMVLGSKTLQETIEHRDAISQEIRDVIDKTAESWGVRVESILLKDVILGRDILQNIASAATQKRIGESKVIAAEAEVGAAKLFREAADILNSSAAMQIRFLETLTSISANSGNKVLFLPTSVEDLTVIHKK
ncbi:hypothetical protein HDV04_001295 [Boothiomyces sp. JEL0838]|nr:hypothetical protein HDV04_003251 [Boothiomyces sp. JEL0838]KAJ3313989.1 hypothetical protein HDV04_001295 [Boothiomyces sp. JEL0838]